jgi:UDP-N-acetylmuramoyl-L-alanyl-D-glutamate--2,6-diaminopimelate ligase
VRLDRLLDAVDVGAVEGDATVDVTAMAYDSRALVAGALFFCVPGEHDDGHLFAPAAVAAGARAVVVERLLDLPVTQVLVASTRAAMGPMSSVFEGAPSRSLSVVGVTGTNGKTTTTYLVQGILESAGRATGIIGTLTGTRTTPEAPDLQARLARLREEGKHAVAMEVSSHALAQHRVDGTRFAVAVFTNLSRDHLDFHGTMEDYFRAKARLFEPALADQAVVNVDDVRGRLLRDAAVVPTTAYSLDDAVDLRVSAHESRFTWRGQPVRVPLGGRFNVSNALAAATACSVLGVADDVIAAGLAAAPSVPGRFEAVDEGQPFHVVVDYAHTPDGLEHVLTAARELTGGRVLLVFGAGGDRDRTKRPAMGEAAARLADVVFLTSDNPRHEPPGAIIDEVAVGIPPATGLTIEPDRRAAIAAALAAAAAGDVVVIAGKGHETTQTIGDDVRPFDDRAVAADELRDLAAAQGAAWSRS